MRIPLAIALALLLLPAALPSVSASCPGRSDAIAVTAAGDTYYVYAGSGDGPAGQEVGIYRESNLVGGLQRPSDTCGGAIEGDEVIFR